MSKDDEIRETCLAMRVRLDDMDKQLDEAAALVKGLPPAVRETLMAVSDRQRARTRAMREQNEKSLKEIETLIALKRRGGLNPGGSA